MSRHFISYGISYDVIINNTYHVMNMKKWKGQKVSFFQKIWISMFDPEISSIKHVWIMEVSRICIPAVILGGV